jgi:putative transposase
MKRFKSARHVQRFVSIHDPIANLFHFSHNQLTAADYRAVRTQAFEDWAEIAGAGLAA